MHKEERKQATIKLDIVGEKRSRERCSKTQTMKNYLLHQKAFRKGLLEIMKKNDDHNQRLDIIVCRQFQFSLLQRKEGSKIQCSTQGRDHDKWCHLKHFKQ
jgi:hypothetical protein